MYMSILLAYERKFKLHHDCFNNVQLQTNNEIQNYRLTCAAFCNERDERTTFGSKSAFSFSSEGRRFIIHLQERKQ